jgi:hypothetical protein
MTQRLEGKNAIIYGAGGGLGGGAMTGTIVNATCGLVPG